MPSGFAEATPKLDRESGPSGSCLWTLSLVVAKGRKNMRCRHLMGKNSFDNVEVLGLNKYKCVSTWSLISEQVFSRS